MKLQEFFGALRSYTNEKNRWLIRAREFKRTSGFGQQVEDKPCRLNLQIPTVSNPEAKRISARR